MSKKTIAPEALLYPMPAVLVGGRAPDGSANFATIAWAGVTNSTPPMLGVGIRKSRHTHGLVSATGEFSVNVPSSKQAAEADYCGMVSGSTVDKVAACGFSIFYGTLENAPLIEQCPVNIACTVEKVVELPSHDYFIGRIVEIHIDEQDQIDRATEDVKFDPLVFMGTHYAKVTGNMGKAFGVGKTIKDAG